MDAPDLLVIGGGPAGLMAAGVAAGRGLRVLLLEKMSRCGRKLRITGKGRCNLTSALDISEFPAQFGRNGLFLRDAFKAFDNCALQSFFTNLGLPTVVERGQRVFPECQSAELVLDTLLDWVREQGVEIRTEAPCKSLHLDKDGRIEALFLDDGRIMTARHYLLACGGASYPLTGSNGDGSRLAAMAGHEIVPLRPALVPLVVEGEKAARFQGVSLKNVRASLVVEGKIRQSLFGEMLFTHFGLSGPIILSLSREAVIALDQGKRVEISLDLKPALSEELLEIRLLRDIANLGRKHGKALLKELVPQKMVEGCLEDTLIGAERPISQLTVKERQRLRGWLKHEIYPITGYRPLNEAIVTQGGVKLKEVDPKTMRSKICSNLSLAGEILDVDAQTGGFNLQAAFSTGYLAGQKALQDVFEG